MSFAGKPREALEFVAHKKPIWTCRQCAREFAGRSRSNSNGVSGSSPAPQCAGVAAASSRRRATTLIRGCAISRKSRWRQHAVPVVNFFESAALGFESEYPEPDHAQDIPCGEVAER